MHHCTIARARAEIGPPKLRAFFGGAPQPISHNKRMASGYKSGPPVLAAICGVSQGALRPLLGQCASRNSRYLTLHHPRKCQWREDEEKPMRRARGGRLEAALARG